MPLMPQFIQPGQPPGMDGNTYNRLVDRYQLRGKHPDDIRKKLEEHLRKPRPPSGKEP